MKIITHPKNIELLRSKIEKQYNTSATRLINGIKFISDSNLEQEKWNGKWEVLQNKYFTYWDGKGQPPSWAIYCGFVKKVMEPVFYIINEPTFLNPNWT